MRHVRLDEWGARHHRNGRRDMGHRPVQEVSSPVPSVAATHQQQIPEDHPATPAELATGCTQDGLQNAHCRLQEGHRTTKEGYPVLG